MEKLYEVYYCSGNGGNKIFIFKDYPLVVVLIATSPTAGPMQLSAGRSNDGELLSCLQYL